MILQDIFKQIDTIEKSIAWANQHKKDSFPREIFKDYRRQVKKIRFSLEERCSAAAYGESQVGKSYLMSSLLSSPDTPFMITNGGNSYSFIDELNPSGGNTSKKESTGIITRFTTKNTNEKMKDYVRARNLSVADIIMLITDSYYNDIKIDPEKALSSAEVNEELHRIFSSLSNGMGIQSYIEEDDIKDIQEYITQIIGHIATNVIGSDFFKNVSQNIHCISPDNWVDIFGLLWNNNADLNRLFSTLIYEYKKIDFLHEVYVPFNAVLRDKGTLLKIDWLDLVCGKSIDLGSEEINTDIYNEYGEMIVTGFNKAHLSAIIAELTFVLPQSVTKDKKFLEEIDLLDFPGARSREKYEEKSTSLVLPEILRRGKVAYLFNKYSRSRRISSILFCHHNDQKAAGSTVGETINSWIEDVVGQTESDRSHYLKKTNGISPLFYVATMFNKDLEKTKNDNKDNVSKLDEHWVRFVSILPEIIKPYMWLENWVTKGGIFRSSHFQSIYLLRDFYWSNHNRVFSGYSDKDTLSPEKEVYTHPDYPDYFEDLKKSFVTFPFVKKHFADPEQSWCEVATVNNDGSKAIIRDLDRIAATLNGARQQKYLTELREILNDILKTLDLYFVSDSDESKNAKVMAVSGAIRRKLYLSVAMRPEVFGLIIDRLMIHSGALRDIAYNITILKTEVPKDFTAINFIRACAGIDPEDGKDANTQKLCSYFSSTVDELDKEYREKGFTVDEVVSSETESLPTVADVVAKRIVDYWGEHINQSVKSLDNYLPHSEEVAYMLQRLLKVLDVQKVLVEKITKYNRIFESREQPNAIADLSSLILNNFVSTIGRTYMNEEHLRTIQSKANACNIDIDVSSNGIEVERKPRPILEVLDALDRSSEIMRQNGYSNNAEVMAVLRKLPLWDNFQRWENLLTIGLLLSNDISECDPVANAQIRSIIDNCNTLYTNL